MKKTGIAQGRGANEIGTNEYIAAQAQRRPGTASAPAAPPQQADRRAHPYCAHTGITPPRTIGVPPDAVITPFRQSRGQE